LYKWEHGEEEEQELPSDVSYPLVYRWELGEEKERVLPSDVSHPLVYRWEQGEDIEEEDEVPPPGVHYP
jgi:hypothetical protein